MKIAGVYSLKGGREIVESKYAQDLRDVEQAIAAVKASAHKIKVSKEKTMPGKLLYDPTSLNKAFKKQMEKRGLRNHKVRTDYPTNFYVPDFKTRASSRGAFREMDFVKNRVGVEIQFGKYSFMVYNVSAKMTIFHKLDLIDVGIEVVPLKEFADDMSTGVSYFEQFVWDLEHRGVADIDIPVLILGITK